MKRTLTLKGIEVNYDIEQLTKEINEYTWESDDYPFISEGETGDEYSMDEERFNSAKEALLEEVANLESTIEQRFNDGIHITKAGRPALNRKNVLIGSDILTSYSNEWGSHSYSELSVVGGYDGTKITLMLTDVGYQSTF